MIHRELNEHDVNFERFNDLIDFIKGYLSMDLIPELASALNAMVGETCWSFAASIVTGSHVSFDIGRKVRRKKPLRNPRISEEERLYTAELHLYVTCSWRLDLKGEVLCGGDDDNSNEGPMRHGLQHLLGRKVIAVELDRPGLDLLLAFEDDLILRVFCDELGIGEDDAENYTLFMPDHYLSVEGRSRVTKSSRSKYGETLDFRLVGAGATPQPTVVPPVLETWKAVDAATPELFALLGGTFLSGETADDEYSPIRLSIQQTGAAEPVDLVVGCSWRLDSATEALCGFRRPAEEIRAALQGLAGQTLTAIDISPGMDLRVHFAGGFRLSIFCDRVNEVSLWDNYLIEGSEVGFIVGTGGAVRRE